MRSHPMFKHEQPFMYNLGLNYLLNNLKISCLTKQGLYNITIKIINYPPPPHLRRFSALDLLLCACLTNKSDAESISGSM